MTELEAVQLILTRNGLRPPAALDTGGRSDAAEAERLLAESDLAIQSEGWHYNTMKDVTLSPDGSNHITVPSDAITIDTYDEDEDIDITGVAGGWLYNLTDHTNAFTSSLQVQYILRMAWGCIPNPVQQLIAETAAVNYNRMRQRSSRIQELETYAARARLKARQFNNDMADHNIFKHDRDMLAVRGDRPRRIVT